MCSVTATAGELLLIAHPALVCCSKIEAKQRPVRGEVLEFVDGFSKGQGCNLMTKANAVGQILLSLHGTRGQPQRDQWAHLQSHALFHLSKDSSQEVWLFCVGSTDKEQVSKCLQGLEATLLSAACPSNAPPLLCVMLGKEVLIQTLPSVPAALCALHSPILKQHRGRQSKT